MNSHFECEYKKARTTCNSSLRLELLIDGMRVSFENNFEKNAITYGHLRLCVHTAVDVMKELKLNLSILN